MKLYKILFIGIFTLLVVSMLAINTAQQKIPSCSYDKELIQDLTKFNFNNYDKLTEVDRARLSFEVGYNFANCE